MKPFFLSITLIAGFSALAQTFFPWWSLTIVAFIVGFFIQQKREGAWFSGVFAIFALWVIYALVLSHANNGILAQRIADLLQPLTGGKVFRLYLMTGALGGLAGGFAALTGRLTALLIFPSQAHTA